MTNYYDEPTSTTGNDPLSNPRVVTAIVLAIAAIIAIIGCVGLYFFLNPGSQPAVQATVFNVTGQPTSTPTLTPIPTETASPTLEEGSGGGGDEPDLTATFAALPAIRYATLTELRGLVQIKNETIGGFQNVTTEQAIPQDTTVLTNEDSSTKVGFTEGSVVRVSSQTQFLLDELSGTTVDPITKLVLDGGKVWSVIGPLGTGKYEVVTPLGTASVLNKAFMSVEYNSTEEIAIITCLEGRCRFSSDSGVQELSTGQQLIVRRGSPLTSPQPMDPGQLEDWNPTKVPEVLTLTPTATSTGTITPTFTPSSTRTPTNTRPPSNTPNAEATSNARNTQTAAAATSTSLAGANAATQTQFAINSTATQNSANLTSTVYFFNVTATALFQSTANSFTATSFSFTATSFQLTQNAISATSAAAATQTALANLPRFSFASSAAAVNEDAGTLNVTINVNPACTVACSVQVRSENQTAINGTDYTFSPNPTTVPFSAGNTSATISIPITNSPTTSEPSETFQLILQNPSGSGSLLGTPTTQTVTINDVVIPTIDFDPGSIAVSAAESSGTATLTVRLSASVTSNVDVAVSFGGGSATGGGTISTAVDYDNNDVTSPVQSGPLVITIPAGQTSTTFDVTIADDGVSETNETLQVTIACSSCPVPVQLGTNVTSTVTIIESGRPTVGFSAGTYSAAESAGDFTVTVNLSRAYANVNTVTVNYALSAGSTATGGAACGGTVDYESGDVSGALSFAPTVQSQTFNVTICDDLFDEPDETINLTLSVTSGNAGNGTLTTAITITDNDTAPTITISPSPTTITEPGGFGTTTLGFTVTLSAQSGQTITVNYGTTPGSASQGNDYQGITNQVLTFNPGITSLPISVTINGDLLYETSETFTLALSSPTNATLGTPSSSLVTITDDGDTAPTASFSASPYQMFEGDSGTTDVTITVNLDRLSGQQIVLVYSTADGTLAPCTTLGLAAANAGVDYNTAGGTLTFNPGVDLSKTFTVPVIGDTAAEATECLILNLSVGSGNVTISNTPSAVVINNDD